MAYNPVNAPRRVLMDVNGRISWNMEHDGWALAVRDHPTLLEPIVKYPTDGNLIQRPAFNMQNLVAVISDEDRDSVVLWLPVTDDDGIRLEGDSLLSLGDEMIEHLHELYGWLRAITLVPTGVGAPLLSKKAYRATMGSAQCLQ
jgi:hypothetical protein